MCSLFPHFQIPCEQAMLAVMETPPARSLPSPLALLGLAIVGAMLLAALGGWSAYGTTILFTYAQDGLAWCF